MWEINVVGNHSRFGGGPEQRIRSNYGVDGIDRSVLISTPVVQGFQKNDMCPDSRLPIRIERMSDTLVRVEKLVLV